MDITFFGQVCFLFQTDNTRFLIDPYFSNSVEQYENPSFKRLQPIPLAPSSLDNIDFVLISHAHRDHCDPDTLVPLAKASPQCQFFGPAPVAAILLKAGIDRARIHPVTSRPFVVHDMEITVIPSAHPTVKIDPRGGWQAVGYLFRWSNKVYYHPGDTTVTPEIVELLKAASPIDVGLLPVNEINYYRNQSNIIGNMSVREAFMFAEELGIKRVIPTHWDMFTANQVYKEEIELLYDRISPNFKLTLLEAGASYVG